MNSEGEPFMLFFEHTTACFLRSSEKAAPQGGARGAGHDELSYLRDSSLDLTSRATPIHDAG